MVTTLENPRMRDIPLPIARKIMPADLPADLKIISADGHWDVSSDVYYERVPAKLRDKAPRIWRDEKEGVVKFGFPDGKGGIIDPFTPEVSRVSAPNCDTPGVHDIKARLAHMDAERISKEINFPQFALAFCHLPDFELREWIFRIYNEAIAEMQASSNGRCFGVGVIANWWDPARARESVDQVVKLGFKTLMLPLYPGKAPDGTPIVWSEPERDSLWTAIEETGLPLCFHVGEASIIQGRGGWGIRVMSTISPFVPTLAQLIFGGVFDRNPGLRIFFAEGGISWAPPALQDGEMIYDSYKQVHSLLPKLRPSEYWAKHCCASFMNDRVGLENMKFIGADTAMWASDYPHVEGTFGYSQGSVHDILKALPLKDARKVIGENAARIFNI